MTSNLTYFSVIRNVFGVLSIDISRYLRLLRHVVVQLVEALR